MFERARPGLNLIESYIIRNTVLDACPSLKSENNEKLSIAQCLERQKWQTVSWFQALLSHHATLTRGHANEGQKFAQSPLPGNTFRFAPNRFGLSPKINRTSPSRNMPLLKTQQTSPVQVITLFYHKSRKKLQKVVVSID
jgi:hypothetical protein